MVVDGGLWSDGSGVPANENRDKIWSEKTTKLLVGDIAGSFDLTKMFDGSTSTYCGGLGEKGATNITYSFHGGLATANSAIRIFCHCGDGVNPVTFKFNNNLISNIPTGSDTDNTPNWIDFSSELSFPYVINSIELQRFTTYDSAVGWIYAIEIDGKILVDGSGETKVTGPAKSGTGTFVSTNGTKILSPSKTVMTSGLTIKNRLGLGFYIKDSITVLNADNPKHVALQQAIADAFAAYPNKVVQRRSAISSLVTQVASTLSDEDAALLYEITDVNAPIAVNGYYPLYTNEADANSAGNGSSHSHTFNGTTYYMPNGVTFYHGNYGTNSY